MNKLKIWKSFTVSSEKLEVGVKQIVASISLEGNLCSVILFWLKLVNILPPSDDGVNWDRIASGQNMVEIKFSEEQLYSFLEVEEQELAANTSMWMWFEIEIFISFYFIF